MMYRCPTCSRDFSYPACPYCRTVFGVPITGTREIIDGKVKCVCGCGQLHPYDPTREGREYTNDEPWVQMLDRHARNFIDMPMVKTAEEFETNEITSHLNPVKAGIFVKMGPKML
mgnify:FL=1